jgi:hypothetical protein
MGDQTEKPLKWIASSLAPFPRWLKPHSLWVIFPPAPCSPAPLLFHGVCGTAGS